MAVKRKRAVRKQVGAGPKLDVLKKVLKGANDVAKQTKVLSKSLKAIEPHATGSTKTAVKTARKHLKQAGYGKK